MFPSSILNYQIIRLIGSGGMGQVFLGRNTSFDQYVAIKMLHPGLASNPVLREKFRQEARMLSSLDHPNIVRFLNYVENEQGVFLIMEYVDGMTLDDFINKKNGLIVEKRAYPMFSQILSAFEYAHSKNIVHLDIKPGNIFLTPDGKIKVLDFGIAKILSEAESGNSSQVMGTPEYMSPEQVIGRNIDRRSDIYSLGVLFHQMLTGRPPYDSTTMSELEIKQRVLNDGLPKMKDYYPYVSDGMQKIVNKATEKLPEKRYRDCSEMARAVRNTLDPQPKSHKSWIYAAVAAVVLLTGAFFVWDYFRVKTCYYTDYVEVFGVPVGIGEISESKMNARSHTYRIEMSRRKPRRLTIVNSKGTPVEHSDAELNALRPADTEYFYTDDGKLDYKKVYDSNGRLLYKLDYDENLKTASYKYDDEYGTPMRIGARTTSVYGDENSDDTERSTIYRQLLTFDDETGYLSSLRFAGLSNEPRPDADNIYGMEFKYDEKGHITDISFLDADAKVRNNHVGLAAKQFKYDDDGNISRIKYLDADGNPAHDGKNCHIVDYTFDEHGNITSEKYFGIDKMPVLRTDLGAFGLVYKYDENGFRTRQTTIDADGNPLNGIHGYATSVLEYDSELGLPSTIAYYDTDDKECINVDGKDSYASMSVEYNDRGLPTSVTVYGLDGKPSPNSSGYATVRYKYNSDGYTVKATYLDANDKPVLTDEHFASITLTYDDLHRETSRHYQDIDGKPANISGTACAIIQEYDVKGNLVSRKYLDANDKPAINNELVHEIKFTYDDMGNETAREFSGTDGKPVMTTFGVSRFEYSYDPNTNLITATRYFTPAGLKQTEMRKFDEYGNVIKEYTLDSKGKLQGVVTNSEFDRFGHLSRQWGSDLDGRKRPLPGTTMAEVVIKHDSRGNATEQACFDVNTKPTLHPNGFHRVKSEYDNLNRTLHEIYFGIDGKPVSASKTNPELRYKYDNSGNVTELAIFDGYGKPINGYDGYHIQRSKYNNRNLLMSIEFVDVSGKIVPAKSAGCARLVKEYDSLGNVKKETYYSNDTTVDYSFAYTYNSNNAVTKILVLDAKGNPNDNRFGFSKVNIVYDTDNVTPRTRICYDRYGNALFRHKYNKAKGEYEY